MRKVNIGLFGLGTVGQGVVKLLNTNRKYIEQQCSTELVLKKVVVQDTQKPRSISTQGLELSTDPNFILEDPTIDVVLEMMGGQTLAADVLFSCLKRNIPLITANKALLAEQALKIEQHNQAGLLWYEASIAGNVPIVRSIAGLKANPIEEVSGILNGTANYILTKIVEDQLDFQAALELAQQKGYAEADPSFDIQGIDTAHKLVLLIYLTFDGIVDYPTLSVEGITNLSRVDIQYASEMGYTIKLLAKATRTAEGIMGYVRPMLVSKQRLLAQVRGTYNAVVVKSKFGGLTVAYGLGAGSEPTASAVIADLISAIQQKPAAKTAKPKFNLLDLSQNQAEFYLRFSVQDQVGVIAQLSAVLQEQKISICSLIQKKHSLQAQSVDVILTTHQTKEAKIRLAVQQIDSLNFVVDSTKVIQLESDNQNFT